MNRNAYFYLIIICLALMGWTACSSPVAQNEYEVKEWDFDNLEGWYFYHQDTASICNFALRDGELVMGTRAGTTDRSKMHSIDTTFTSGTYTWRVHVPDILPGERMCISGFLYHDNRHELDIEIGPGQTWVRRAEGVAPGLLLASLTSLGFPYLSSYTPVRPGWHEIQIVLALDNDNHYVASWLIDGVVCQRCNLEYGPEVSFRIGCSAENLKFIGDTPTTKDYYVRFDKMTYTSEIIY